MLVILFPGFARLRRPKTKGDLSLSPSSRKGELSRSASTESYGSLAVHFSFFSFFSFLSFFSF